MDEQPNALDVAEYQYCSTAYDYRIHPDADKTIRYILKQLRQATILEAIATLKDMVEPDGESIKALMERFESEI